MFGDKPQPFSKKPDFAVIDPLTDSDVRQPRVRISNGQDRLIAFTLASEHIFSSANEVYNTPVGLVMDAYYYVKFKNDFQNTTLQLNKEQRK